MEGMGLDTPTFHPQGLKDRRNNFLRRKSTTPLPEITDTDTDTTDIETTTAKFRRGASRFKSRTKESQPSLSDARRAEQPKRNYLRRKPGGDGPSSTSSPGTVSSTLATLAARRPFRVASRRRPFTSTSSTTSSTSSTTSTTTTTETPEIESDEDFLQDVEENEYIDHEDPPASQKRVVSKKPKIQRRPLVSLKEEDQNPSATNEEENKRQSKKYSSTFKKNRLEQALKDRDHDEDYTTERKTFTTSADDDDISAETAVAIAAHQLLSAPIPVIPNYDEDSKPRKSSSPKTVTEFEFTSPQYTETFTDSKKIYHDDLSSTTVVPTAYVQSSTGPEYSLSPVTFDAPKIQTTSFAAPQTTYSTAYTTKVPQPLVSEPTITHVGLTGTRYPLAKDTYSTDYTTKDASSAEFTGPTTSNSDIPTKLTYPEVPTTSFVPKPSYRTFPVKESKPTGFSLPDFRSTAFTDKSTLVPKTSRPLTNSRVSGSTVAPTGRFLGSSPKLIAVPVEDYAFSTDGYTGLSQEPAYFTREYLLESPVTKAYDDEYQYLSPVTTPQTTTRKVARKKVNRRISTTLRPTTEAFVPVGTTTKPRRKPTVKPFEKVQKASPNRTYRPILNYDYYDDSAEKVAEKYVEGTKVVLHAKGNIECLDIGNFPHPTSCKKFISCARMESGALLGWEYVCPKGLSFDPVGGICNWSAGLGCVEKDA